MASVNAESAPPACNWKCISPFGFVVATLLVSLMVVRPVAMLNAGPALIPGSPGYNGTSPTDSWTFRVQPNCVGPANVSQLALTYIKAGVTAASLPWIFTAGCRNAQPLDLSAVPNESGGGYIIQSTAYAEPRLLLICLLGALGPFVALCFIATENCARHHQCPKWVLTLATAVSLAWMVGSALLGTMVFSMNVDDTTLCTPLLNAQYDGYGQLVSRDWSLVTSAHVSWYINDEKDYQWVARDVIPYCAGAWLDSDSHYFFVPIISHPDLASELAALRAQLLQDNCWLFFLVLAPFVVVLLGSDGRCMRKECRRFCVAWARKCSDESDAPLLSGPAASAPPR